MVTILLVLICVIYIGLGLPDSLLGAAWPSIYPDFNIPVGNASILTVLISFFTALTSFFSARFINKFGTGLVTTVSTLLTAVGLLGFALSNSFIWLCVLAVPLGIGAGAIDAALNDYVANHYKSSHMSFLHSFYGIGVAVSPYIMSFALGGAGGWRQGYLNIFFIQLGIFALSVVALSLWKKVKSNQPTEENFTPITLRLKHMIKMPSVRLSWIVFFSTCALEFTCGIWGCTYLVSSQGLNEAVAAKYITLYYIGITVGRLISGFISSKIDAKIIVYSGYTFVAVALVLLVLPIPAPIKGIALFLIGLGNGPTFPNLSYMTPQFFGRDISRSIMGTTMVTANLGICLAPPLFGLIAQHVDVGLFPYYLILLYVAMLVSTIAYLKCPKQKSSDIKF